MTVYVFSRDKERAALDEAQNEIRALEEKYETTKRELQVGMNLVCDQCH